MLRPGHTLQEGVYFFWEVRTKAKFFLALANHIIVFWHHMRTTFCGDDVNKLQKLPNQCFLEHWEREQILSLYILYILV